jgi:hypothetical protein
VGLFLEEKIPKGIFLIEKWLSFETEMYDMIVLGRETEKKRRLKVGRQLSAEAQLLMRRFEAAREPSRPVFSSPKINMRIHLNENGVSLRK